MGAGSRQAPPEREQEPAVQTVGNAGKAALSLSRRSEGVAMAQRMQAHHRLFQSLFPEDHTKERVTFNVWLYSRRLGRTGRSGWESTGCAYTSP